MHIITVISVVKLYSIIANVRTSIYRGEYFIFV